MKQLELSNKCGGFATGACKNLASGMARILSNGGTPRVSG